MAIFFDSSKPFVENMKPFFAPGVSQAEIIATYNSRKDTYEKDNPPDLYKAPTITAEKTTEVVFNKCARILDVGSGTGLVGEELSKRGYCNVDALEPSMGCIETAQKKKVYKNIMCDVLGGKKVQIENGSYDAVVCCGSFMPNFIPPSGIKKLVRIAKSGGCVVILLRREFCYEGSYGQELQLCIDELKESKEVEVIEIQNAPYRVGVPGVCVVLRVT
uniref:Williams-Beuren syndrome chromosomal region 27 protein-like n=1 Tax=Saccoglossus kowalevskii TaxID=10224 RepID=A0ABM0M0Z2_SACKO|nr:PREDICTED: Williams-Beuren syndrome chromosomal region 27 protein-like [Saccoglossus kowalevskii]